MIYTSLGQREDAISVIGFGGWAIGGHGYGKVDDSQSIVAVNKALDLGITIFDTADVYGFGHSEEVLGKALGRRVKDILVATKFGVRWNDSGKTVRDCSVAYIRQALEGSLGRLKTDCIPLYQLHWHDGVTPLSDVFEALQRLREEGKIRYVGCSNISTSDFRGSADTGTVVSAQLPFSVVSRQSSNDLDVYHRRYGMATLAYDVLARGLLSGKYGKDTRFREGDTRGRDPEFLENLDRNRAVVEGIRSVAVQYGRTPSQVAIRWVLEHPAVSCALVGMKTVEQVSENAGAVGWRLEEGDRAYLGSLGEG